MYTYVVAWQRCSATPFRLRHGKQKVQNSVVQRSDIEQATATMDSNCWLENSYLSRESTTLDTVNSRFQDLIYMYMPYRLLIYGCIREIYVNPVYLQHHSWFPSWFTSWARRLKLFTLTPRFHSTIRDQILTSPIFVLYRINLFLLKYICFPKILSLFISTLKFKCAFQISNLCTLKCTNAWKRWNILIFWSLFRSN